MSPPEVKWGKDTCDRCKMIIDDPRFAAAYRLTSGQQRQFDDIGGMVLHIKDEAEKIASIWVRDYSGARWLAADSAFYVQGARLTSPMGYGVAAVDSEEAAKALAQETGGEVFSWPQLLERGVSSPRSQ